MDFDGKLKLKLFENESDLFKSLKFEEFSSMFLDVSDKDWINKVFKKEDIIFVIEFDRKQIGVTKFENIDWTNKSAEFVIYIINKEYCNKGIETEVTKKMLQYAFEFLNFNRIYTRVFEYDKDMIKIFKNCGFLQEGVERQAKFFKGKYWDIIRFSMLSENYWRLVEELLK